MHDVTVLLYMVYDVTAFLCIVHDVTVTIYSAILLYLVYEWRLEEVMQWLKQLSPSLYQLYKSNFIKHDIIGNFMTIGGCICVIIIDQRNCVMQVKES